MVASPAGGGEVQDAASVFLRFLQTSAPHASATGESMTWTWRHA